MGEATGLCCGVLASTYASSPARRRWNVEAGEGQVGERICRTYRVAIARAPLDNLRLTLGASSIRLLVPAGSSLG